MASDNYRFEFECPECKQGGEAHVSENDGWAYMRRGPERSVSLPSGFTLIRAEPWPCVIRCDNCKLEFQA